MRINWFQQYDYIRKLPVIKQSFTGKKFGQKKFGFFGKKGWLPTFLDLDCFKNSHLDLTLPQRLK